MSIDNPDFPILVVWAVALLVIVTYWAMTRAR